MGDSSCPLEDADNGWNGSARMVGSVQKSSDSKSPQGRSPRFAGYGLQIGGGRTRIRTRVFGLEGQSDIQLHYTSSTGSVRPYMKVVHRSEGASALDATGRFANGGAFPLKPTGLARPGLLPEVPQHRCSHPLEQR